MSDNNQQTRGNRREWNEAVLADASAIVHKFEATSKRIFDVLRDYTVKWTERGVSVADTMDHLRKAMKSAKVNVGTIRAYATSIARYIEVTGKLPADLKASDCLSTVKEANAKAREAAREAAGESGPAEPVELSNRQKMLSKLATDVALLTDDQLSTILLAVEAMLPEPVAESDTDEGEDEGAEPVGAAEPEREAAVA
jgi:hypothetical protein